MAWLVGDALAADGRVISAVNTLAVLTGPIIAGAVLLSAIMHFAANKDHV